MKIKSVFAHEILDSRAKPTVRATVVLENGICASASVPSGASTGEFEAVELRDGDESRYNGFGVLRAVHNVNTEISKVLSGIDVFDQEKIDSSMCEADGTENKSRLGANAILATSLAVAHAGAKAQGIPLYRYIGTESAHLMPMPMMNILNGGAHANNNIDIQEFMIMPVSAKDFSDAVRMCAEVFYALKEEIARIGGTTTVGDEGGFAPMLGSDEEAIKLLLSAIQNAGFVPGTDFVLSIDAASSEWFDGKVYRMPKSGKVFSTDELIDYWQSLTMRYPVKSIEDGLSEHDWEGWKKLTQALGHKCQLVGDDLFVTNKKRLADGIEKGCANSILIKPNQIGTLTETIEAVKLAHKNGYTAIMSHRSGETADTTIADLAVALHTGQIKTGAPSRAERTEKYNRLMFIENDLDVRAKLYNLKKI